MTQDSHWNLTQIATAFQMHRDTVRKRLVKAGVDAAGLKGNSPLYDLAQVGPALFGAYQNQEPSKVDPDELDPMARKAWFDSENARLKFEQECQNLIPAHEVAREFAEFAKSIVNPLDGLPDVLERKAGLSGRALELVQKNVDAVREQMFLRVINRGGELETDERLRERPPDCGGHSPAD